MYICTNIYVLYWFEYEIPKTFQLSDIPGLPWNPFYKSFDRMRSLNRPVHPIISRTFYYKQ